MICVPHLNDELVVLLTFFLYHVLVSGLRLVEVTKVMEGHRSLELEEFMSGVADQLDETNETLGQWFTQIQTIFFKVMEPSVIHSSL